MTTGWEVQALRNGLAEHAGGFSGVLFGRLLGVHPTTIYRWESANEAPLDRMEPLQMEILEALITLWKSASKTRRTQLAQALKVALQRKPYPTLQAIHRLVEELQPRDL